MYRKTLFSRLLASHLLLAVSAVAILALGVNYSMQRRALNAIRERLLAEARTVGAAIDGLPEEEVQPLIAEMAARSGSRLTIVHSDGRVLADSAHDPKTMENHAGRPEIAEALRLGDGFNERTSGTLGRRFLYAASAQQDGLVVRVALPFTVVAEQLSGVRTAIALASLLIVVLVLAASTALARILALPLKRMAAEVEASDTDAPMAITAGGTRETRTLGEAINQMAARLADKLDELSRESSLRDQILSNLEDGVLLFTESGKVIFANQAAKNLLGRRELAEVPPEIKQPGESDFVTHYPTRRELRSKTFDTPDRRRLSVIEDVTHARRVDRVRRDFVANASHELKTPLAAMLATAETIQAATLDDPAAAQRFSEKLTEEGRRLARLVEDLLDLARLEQAPGHSETIPASAVVLEEIARAQPVAESKGLRIVSEVETDLHLRGSREDLVVAVRNLISNGISYTEKGSVTVSLRSSGKKVEIEVADTGIGIPEAELERIFERFYRVDKGRSPETGGTGLGLSIVRHSVERLGGLLDVVSEVGKGSRFTIRIPVAPSDMLGEAETAAV